MVNIDQSLGDVVVVAFHARYVLPFLLLVLVVVACAYLPGLLAVRVLR
jgi:hypothetical protein